MNSDFPDRLLSIMDRKDHPSHWHLMSPEGTKDQLRWYCPDDIHLVHEAEFRLQHIDQDLHKIMDNFWNGPEEIRTCKETGKVITRAGEFDISNAEVMN